jgi:uncharacterized protein (DUF433 family)
MVPSYQRAITLEPGKRGDRPCVRGMRIAVADVLGWLACGLSHREIIANFPELTEDDIRACLADSATANGARRPSCLVAGHRWDPRVRVEAEFGWRLQVLRTAAKRRGQQTASTAPKPDFRPGAAVKPGSRAAVRRRRRA